MAKIRIYIESKDISNLIDIRDKNLIHKIKNVLRLKKESLLYVFDGKGAEYMYKIEAVTKKNLVLVKAGVSQNSCFPEKKIVLGFPLVREEKIDFILQKATELGAGAFIPFICERSLKGKLSKQKDKRWKKIIIEAVGQSRRLWMPEISRILDFEEVVEGKYENKLAASIKGEDVGNILDSKKDNVLILVGPEGDFSPSEYNQLEKSNFKFFKLSSNILRVETACIFSVGLVNYTINNYDSES